MLSHVRMHVNVRCMLLCCVVSVYPLMFSYLDISIGMCVRSASAPAHYWHLHVSVRIS